MQTLSATAAKALQAGMGDNYFREGAEMLTAVDMMMVTATNGARIVSVTMSDIATVMVAPLV